MPASDSGIKGSHLHFMDNDRINACNSRQKIHMILPNMIQTQQDISVTKKYIFPYYVTLSTYFIQWYANPLKIFIVF